MTRRTGALALALLWLSPLAALGEGPLEQSVERGPVTATLRLEPAAPVIGDPLTLELEVTAEAGVELLMPEFGEALDRFAIIDFMPEERVEDDGRTVVRQRYTLQASRSGVQSIPPLLVEFVDRRSGRTPAPEGEDAYELLTESLEFEVGSVLPADAPLELRARLGALDPLPTPGLPRWPFVLAALVVGGALTPFAARAWLAYRARARQRSAYDIARAALDGLLASARPGADEMDAFFVALSGIVRRYLEDRFALRSPELTTEEFLDVMKDSPELRREHQRSLQRFLERADLVKFARDVPAAEDVEESVQTAQRFLEETREAGTPSPDARSGRPDPRGAEAARA